MVSVQEEIASVKKPAFGSTLCFHWQSMAGPSPAHTEQDSMRGTSHFLLGPSVNIPKIGDNRWRLLIYHFIFNRSFKSAFEGSCRPRAQLTLLRYLVKCSHSPQDEVLSYKMRWWLLTQVKAIETADKFSFILRFFVIFLIITHRNHLIDVRGFPQRRWMNWNDYWVSQ